jgi:hypothetical protein
VPEIDGAAMLRALAREDTLRVFAAVITATGTGRPRRSGNTISRTYTTVHGVSRDTGLPDTVVVGALSRLTEAHLIVASQGGDAWRTDFSAMEQALASLPG